MVELLVFDRHANNFLLHKIGTRYHFSMVHSYLFQFYCVVHCTIVLLLVQEPLFSHVDYAHGNFHNKNYVTIEKTVWLE